MNRKNANPQAVPEKIQGSALKPGNQQRTSNWSQSGGQSEFLSSSKNFSLLLAFYICCHKFLLFLEGAYKALLAQC